MNSHAIIDGKKEWPVGLRFKKGTLVTVIRGDSAGKVGTITGVHVTATPTRIWYTVDLGSEFLAIDSRRLTLFEEIKK